MEELDRVVESLEQRVSLTEKMPSQKNPNLDNLAWSNPDRVDLTKPYLYVIRIKSPHAEFRYVGKASSRSRMDAYRRNVTRIFAGKTKRPAVKKDGQPQSDGNIKYRQVHLYLAVALSEGWGITHQPLENCSKQNFSELERQRRDELDCQLNGGESWHVQEFASLSADHRLG